MRIFAVESPRFPEEGSSPQGKSGPKPRAKAVGDGQSVEIPIPPTSDIREAVTQEDRWSELLVELVQAVSPVSE